MGRWISSALLALFLAASLAAQQSSPPPSALPTMRSAYGDKLRLPGVPNGGRITGNLYRGAQPRPNGLPELKKLGITTIVDLRGENPQLRDAERRQAEALGIRFVNIPVSGWAPPNNEQVAQFLALFRSDQEKVFVHCRFGDDRTGVFVAAYRMAYENWPAEQAMNEMYFFGFNGFWHPSMKSFIRDFPARLRTAPVLSAYRPPTTIVTKCDKTLPAAACSN